MNTSNVVSLAAYRRKASPNAETALESWRRMLRGRCRLVEDLGLGWVHACNEAVDVGGMHMTIPLDDDEACPFCGAVKCITQ